MILNVEFRAESRMGEEFLLKWNDYQSSFSSMMESICLTEEMTDGTIAVGERTFYAHRWVWSADPIQAILQR